MGQYSFSIEGFPSTDSHNLKQARRQPVLQVCKGCPIPIHPQELDTIEVFVSDATDRLEFNDLIVKTRLSRAYTHTSENCDLDVTIYIFSLLWRL